MSTDAIIVSTYKTLEQMQYEGGCGYWPIGADPSRAHSLGARYVVCVRNRNGFPKPPPDHDDIEHGRAFLIGKLSPQSMPVDMYTENRIQRQLLLMSDVALLPETLPIQKVTENFYYGSIGELGIKIDTLKFKRFIKSVAQAPSAYEEPVGSNDFGPDGGGIRSEATWSARQRPLALMLVSELSHLGWRETDGCGWKPDILMRDSKGRCVLIEVKPDFGLHNALTALGQVLCYRQPHDEVVSIIAAEGGTQQLPNIASLLERHAVQVLDLASKEWRAELERLLATGFKHK